ncbi:cell division protein FtsA [Gimibacter soli]|uniref:Cell division protein FtsA n=1 Tax=Gimibacter soli TaxID=3024400 RepID=A0AAF0BN32_9PROT|nr:cell division protein FtsA [Gimibacter soli]WCL55455.1 cell division protein FtsA [Gimibacter soli]
MSARNEGLIAALDVGSAKVACLIAEIGPSGQITVKGVGNRACHGVSAGAVIDMAETEKAIRASVDQAERMAGATIADVVLSFSGGDPRSAVIEAEIEIGGHAVAEADVIQVVNKARSDFDPGDASILHAVPAAYSLDGNYSPHPPVGMYGKKLGVALHIVTCDDGPLRNLEACVRRAHLNVADVVLAPYAAGLATLVEDEAKMGAASIDIGGGTAGISVFAQGALVHSEVVPIGGSHVTEEVARALLTPFEHAERLKTFNGSALPDQMDNKVEIEVPQVGETDRETSFARMPRSALNHVVQRELETLFATVGDRLDASGFGGVSGRRVVLSGGVAQTEGVRELAAAVLGRQVRIGRPTLVGGLPAAAQSPSFATAVGMLIYTARMQRHGRQKSKNWRTAGTKPKGTIAKLVYWIRENF